MKQCFPVRRSLELNVYKTRNEMGKAAAKDVAAAMKKYIKAKGKVVMVFAAAPSQDEFLAHLAKIRGIDWNRVVCFHLDEYVDLPRNHPNTFEAYLREHLFDLVKPGTVYFLKGLKGNGQGGRAAVREALAETWGGGYLLHRDRGKRPHRFQRAGVRPRGSRDGADHHHR